VLIIESFELRVYVRPMSDAVLLWSNQKPARMAATPAALSDKPSREYARSVSIWNDGGGVGKTTLAAHISGVLGSHDRDVLAIDLDPQAGCLTHHMGFEAVMDRPRYEITPVLTNDNRTLDELVISGDEYDMDFDLIPAHGELGDFSASIAQNVGPRTNPKRLLRRAIADAGLHTEYDTIIIDVPATRGKLVQNCICATRNVLIPTEVTPKGLASVDGLHSYVSELQRTLRSETGNEDLELSVIGVVPNAGAKNGSLGATERDKLTTLYEEEMFDLVPFMIPNLNFLPDVWDSRKSIPEFVASEDTRELRPAEQEVPVMFEQLASLVEAGHIDALEGYQDRFYEEIAAAATEGNDE
jgi:chromosome partitioning protein